MYNNTAVTTDASGTAVEISSYTPYGDLSLDDKVSSFQEQRKYGGYELDIATGLSYLGSRYYNSASSRFLSPDPRAHSIADPGLITDPQLLNLYNYGRSNPVKYRDNHGESATLTGAVGGALIGGGLGLGAALFRFC